MPAVVVTKATILSALINHHHLFRRKIEATSIVAMEMFCFSGAPCQYEYYGGHIFVCQK